MESTELLESWKRWVVREIGGSDLQRSDAMSAVAKAIREGKSQAEIITAAFHASSHTLQTSGPASASDGNDAAQQSEFAALSAQWARWAQQNFPDARAPQLTHKTVMDALKEGQSAELAAARAKRIVAQFLRGEVGRAPESQRVEPGHPTAPLAEDYSEKHSRQASRDDAYPGPPSAEGVAEHSSDSRTPPNVGRKLGKPKPQRVKWRIASVLLVPAVALFLIYAVMIDSTHQINLLLSAEIPNSSPRKSSVNVLEVGAGQEVLLRWHASGASEVCLWSENEARTVTSQTVCDFRLDGSFTIRPDRTTVYGVEAHKVGLVTPRLFRIDRIRIVVR